MKKIIFALAAAAFAFPIYAQTPAGVPMNVSIFDESSNIPAASAEMLATRMKAAVANSGMGATEDVTQFFLTAKSSLLDKHIVSGAPAKYFNASELTFFVVDAFAQRVFTSFSLEVKGIGNSEQQAYTNGYKEFKAGNPKLIAYLKDSNKKILEYYDSQYPVIITEANSLALVKKYEEALFRLSTVPQACIGYTEVVETATRIFQKYLDDKSFEALAKARAIWNAGQDSAAASEAGVYLAQIDPNSKYYQEAVELNNEIKERIHSDIDYYRAIEARDAEYRHGEKMSSIEAWRQVGVAYGNNQKNQYYKSVW